MKNKTLTTVQYLSDSDAVARSMLLGLLTLTKPKYTERDGLGVGAVFAMPPKNEDVLVPVLSSAKFFLRARNSLSDSSSGSSSDGTISTSWRAAVAVAAATGTGWITSSLTPG